MSLFPKTNFGGYGFGGNLDPRENVKDAGRAQEGWINAAADARRRGYQNALNQWRDTFAPYQGFGGRRTAAWEALLDDPSSITSNPGYDFRRRQGMEGLENSAVARGGLLSGNALRAITEYGQDYASNEYDKALGREMQGAQFGATVDTNYANAVSQLEKEMGLSDAMKYGDLSNYAFWHEQQGMDEAKQWFGFLRGALGGKSGGNNVQSNNSGIVGNFDMGDGYTNNSNNSFLSYYNQNGGGNGGYPVDRNGNIDWDAYLRGGSMNFRY